MITKIQELKQITPREDWVVLTKNQILIQEMGRDKKPTIVGFLSRFNFRWVLLPAFSFCLILGIFALSQSSLPGDSLYPLKKMTEKSRVLFISQEQKPKLNLELANKRLQDLTKIVQNNDVKKLAPAIKEFQANISEAVKNLSKIKATSSDPVMIKKIVEETKKLEENKQKVEALGVKVGDTEELDNALSQWRARLVESEIKEMEGKELSENQQQILAEIKQDFENGDYSSALEKILLLSYPQDK